MGGLCPGAEPQGGRLPAIRSGIRAGSGRGGVGGSARGDVRGSARGGGGGGSVFGTRVEVGRSEVLGASWRRASSCEDPGDLLPPAASRPVAPRPFQRLPPTARRSSGDEFRHLFRDDPGNALYAGAAGGRGRGGKMVVVRSVPLPQETRASRGSALLRLPAGAGGVGGWGRDERGGPGPSSAGAGTVWLLRAGVTEVPGTWPSGRLGRTTRRMRAAATADRRRGFSRCQKRGAGCGSGIRVLRLPAAGAWGHGVALRAHCFRGLGMGWHGVSARRGPRGPLFQLHVARFSCQARGKGGGRSEGAAALTCQL